jgi:hypothetical protein
MALQHLRSSTADKRPTPGAMSDGQLAINTNGTSPGLFFKDSSGALVKVGPVHVGSTAPNVSPASGGETGNTLGEQWLDTTGGSYVLKIWDGSAWRSEASEFVNASGDTMTGALVMDNQQQVRFRETTANGTNYIALQAPGSVASDKTITLPDQTGTVLVSGGATIVDADISATAEIAVSKLADGAARQLLQTDAAGTGVEWASNIDVPGTLDVTGAATFDSSVAVTGALTKSGSNVVTVGDTGTVTSTMIADGTIVDADVNASAAIAGTKISPDFGSQNVTTTGNVTVNAQGDVRFGDADSSNWVAFQGPATVSSNVTWTLPSADGTANQVLSTNGSGTLSWATAAAGGASVTTSDTAPSTPVDGDLWYDSVGGRLYVYYQDPNGSQWVDAAPQGGGSSTPTKIEVGNTKAEVTDTGSNGTFAVTTEGTERARVDSSGRLLIGTSSARENTWNSTLSQSVQIEGTSSTGRSLGIFSSAASSDGCSIILGHQRSGSIGGNTVLQSQDDIGLISFQGSDGSEFVEAARIRAEVDGTPGANDMPGRIVLATTPDGSASPVERVRIDQSGRVGIGKTPNGSYDSAGVEIGQSGIVLISRSNDTPVFIDRKTSDGTLIQFLQDAVGEGSISVSGTTVSYNGAHLSRWSQLPGGSTREEILRGTVLSNIDEMCEWGEEENEQLNRMKVSDVEGDPNVSGVFQAWDDDDDTYTDDFYCAMTGDFIIRISAGIPVHRGQLLMSAGDGTAKPQDDDIIRSKTIAKVTSNHVTCTYDDGSYCVPCVLMAC